MFSGAMTAMVTPFRGEAVDVERLKANVEFQISKGISALVPCGTTGESPTLSHAEHDQVIEVVVAAVGGRVPVIAGAGSNSTAEALRLTAHARDAGADATLQVCPYYNKPTQEGLYRHFMTLADGVDLPIVLYNIPPRCVIGLEVATIGRLAEHPNIVAIKEATGSLDFASQVAEVCDLAIISGDDSLTLPLMSIGGRGVISVLSNLLPERMSQLVEAGLKGDFQAARRIHFELLRLFKVMFIETSPGPIKTAMSMMGMDSGQLRPPLCEVTESTRKALTEALAGAELVSPDR
jgi:4-hydroxy-tetrahydrodipicolinate synthase